MDTHRDSEAVGTSAMLGDANRHDFIDSVAHDLSIRGTALGIISVILGVLTLGCLELLGFVVYLVWLDPSKAYGVVTMFLIPIGTLLITHKAQIEKTLKGYMQPFPAVPPPLTTTTITTTTAVTPIDTLPK